MEDLPFELVVELEGWSLLWASVETRGKVEGLSDLRHRVAVAVRERFPQPADITAHPPVSAMRKLFREAGCDPTRYRPASEALLRRLVKGAELPAIHPLVDVNNCLSAELAVPCCVMADGTLGTTFSFRAGLPGESYESLRGPFNLEGKPLLVDDLGPVDTPITGGVRVKVQPETQRAWLVAYLPADEISTDDAWSALRTMCCEVGIAVDRRAGAP
jgi:DNA/RNA-binding domain of Phe-tRNA-synthetase-like protein